MINSGESLKVKEPQVVGPDYVQSFDNLSTTDFMKIYLETLKFQDPFRQQDLSKSIEDVVRLNQIRFYTDMKFFLKNLSLWMNQMTFMQSLSMIGKNFIFETDILDNVKGGEYYILSAEKLKDVKVKIYDGEEVIKELTVDLEKGLNPLDISDLPKGQFKVELFKGDTQLLNWKLGFKDTVQSAGIIDGELMLDLLSGRQISASRIIYAGV